MTDINSLNPGDWTYGANGYLGKVVSQDGGNAFQQNSQYLILGVVLLVVWFLLSAMFAYYMYQFMKAKTKNKIMGRGMLWGNLVMCVVGALIAALVLSFWGHGKPVFGDTAADAKRDSNTIIALVVIGFVNIVAAIVMMWFFLPYYGIAFDDRRILFMGEDIQYKSISKILIDEKTRATYINYTVGKRTHKKLKFSEFSPFGMFIQKNAELTGHSIEEGNEKEYFQSLITSDKNAERNFDKQVQEKIRNKDARTTDATEKPVAKKTASKSKSKSSTSKSKSKTK